MSEISIFLATGAGMISFLSPCVLPLVPAYISFISGDVENDRVEKQIALKRSLLFVLGFSIIFIVMGASASLVGQIFFRYNQIFTKVSGTFIVFFGLYMMGLFHLSFLSKERRIRRPKTITNGIGAFFMGVAFAAGWTPCVGSVLAGILLYAGTTATIYKGILLLLMYSLGLGIPFILTALLTKEFQYYLRRYERFVPHISKLGGFVMVLLGLAIYFNRMIQISQYFNFINPL